MTTTLADIGTAALNDLGVLEEGEELNAGHQAVIMFAANALIDKWKAQFWSFYTVTRTLLTLASSDGEYTVGTGGDLAISRPPSMDHIEDVRLVNTAVTPNYERPLQRLTDAQYRAIPIKSQESSQPTSWYYNPTYPLGKLTLYPAPNVSTLKAAVYARGPVPEFSAITDTVDLPPGYRMLLMTHLAIRLAPTYGRQPSASLVREAEDVMATIRRTNDHPIPMEFPAEALFGNGGRSFDPRNC